MVIHTVLFTTIIVIYAATGKEGKNRRESSIGANKGQRPELQILGKGELHLSVPVDGGVCMLVVKPNVSNVEIIQ